MRPSAAMLAGAELASVFDDLGLRHYTSRCGYAGFQLEVVGALGDVLVRLAAEHSSATSRARADLLLSVVVPRKLTPCGILG